MMSNDFGELHIMRDGKMEIIPTYTCGHCTTVVVMHPNRKRERTKCWKCQKYLCEKNSICRSQCTPMHAMARDHFEGAGEFGKMVPAIMNGCTSVDEGVEKKLIIP